MVSDQLLKECIKNLAEGSGPIAIDTERASGYKYSSRAYLIQVKRKNKPIYLIDPISISDKSLWQQFNDTFAKVEWIIHASTQDLPCLKELGLYPNILFDTELGARLCGFPKVALGTLVEELMGLELAKEHSAVDWSTRPLKDEWLNYAALDVDLLIELRDLISSELTAQEKLTFAQAEFAQILQDFKVTKTSRKDPWRRTSGMHKVKDRLTMYVISKLWQIRDEIAQELDLAPHRVLQDEAMVDLAAIKPKTNEEIAKVIGRRTRLESPPFQKWLKAINDALSADESNWPPLRVASNSIPPTKIWRQKNPTGYARLMHARANLLAVSAAQKIPVENLFPSEALKQLCWATAAADQNAHDKSALEKYVTEMSGKFHARDWQLKLCLTGICEALKESEPPKIEPETPVEGD